MLDLNPSNDFSMSSYATLELLTEILRKSHRVIKDRLALLNNITSTVGALIQKGVLFRSRERRI